jgi:hypothetical protein
MEYPGSEDVHAAVRNWLAVVGSSVYLIRRYLDDGGGANPQVERHLSRIEESLQAAVLALEDPG